MASFFALWNDTAIYDAEINYDSLFSTNEQLIMGFLNR